MQRVALYYSPKGGLSGLSQIESLALSPNIQQTASAWISKEFARVRVNFLTPIYLKIIWSIFGLLAVIGAAIAPKFIKCGLILLMISILLCVVVLIVLLYKKSLRLQMVKNLRDDLGIVTQGAMVLVVSMKVFNKKWGGLFVPTKEELLFKLSVMQTDIERRNRCIRERGLLLSQESNVIQTREGQGERLL